MNFISEELLEASNYGTKTASGNARIFNCTQCKRAFTREEHLTRHTLSTHNKLKPFTCGICQRPFSRRDLLLRHAKNLHQGSELAVSRIRKSFKRDEAKEEKEEPLLNVGQVLEKMEGYESPDKKRMKMSVNMLVS